MKRIPIAWVILAIAIFLALAFLFIFKKPATAPSSLPQNGQEGSPQTKIEDEILKNALNLYIQKKEEGVDFSNGPCLGKIADDWVADIAHNPRQPVDDKPENQCADFRQGRAKHFVELDENGNLIKSF